MFGFRLNNYVLNDDMLFVLDFWLKNNRFLMFDFRLNDKNILLFYFMLMNNYRFLVFYFRFNDDNHLMFHFRLMDNHKFLVSYFWLYYDMPFVLYFRLNNNILFMFDFWFNNCLLNNSLSYIIVLLLRYCDIWMNHYLFWHNNIFSISNILLFHLLNYFVNNNHSSFIVMIDSLYLFLLSYCKGSVVLINIRVCDAELIMFWLFNYLILSLYLRHKYFWFASNLFHYFFNHQDLTRMNFTEKLWF